MFFNIYSFALTQYNAGKAYFYQHQLSYTDTDWSNHTRNPDGLAFCLPLPLFPPVLKRLVFLCAVNEYVVCIYMGILSSNLKRIIINKVFMKYSISILSVVLQTFFLTCKCISKPSGW